MARRERHMVHRVPILRQDHVVEVLGHAVDDADHLVAVLNRQAAAGQEAILHVDHDQRARWTGFDLVGGESHAGPSKYGLCNATPARPKITSRLRKLVIVPSFGLTPRATRPIEAQIAVVPQYLPARTPGIIRRTPRSTAAFGEDNCLF